MKKPDKQKPARPDQKNETMILLAKQAMQRVYKKYQRDRDIDALLALARRALLSLEKKDPQKLAARRRNIMTVLQGRKENARRK